MLQARLHRANHTSIHELEITDAHWLIFIQWGSPDYHSIKATYEARINNSPSCPPQLRASLWSGPYPVCATCRAFLQDCQGAMSPPKGNLMNWGGAQGVPQKKHAFIYIFREKQIYILQTIQVNLIYWHHLHNWVQRFQSTYKYSIKRVLTWIQRAFPSPSLQCLRSISFGQEVLWQHEALLEKKKKGATQSSINDSLRKSYAPVWIAE